MTDFNYKKYSLEKLEEWMYDAMSCDEITPQDIFDVIKGVVEDNYYNYKHHTNRAYELLALLNGNGKGHIQEYDESETTVTCDQDDSSPECKKNWSVFWEDNDIEDEDFQHASINDKVKKWILPVEADILGEEYFLTLPEDLLEQVGWKENDVLEWSDNNDGTFSFTLKKVSIENDI